jgi:DivIVA domain-containing protein
VDLTGNSIRAALFRRSLRGYDTAQVDEFLEEAAIAADALLFRLHRLDTKQGQGGATAGSTQPAPPLAVPTQPAPPLAVPTQPAPSSQGAGDASQLTMSVAQRAAQKTLDGARAEAGGIIAEARRRAEQEGRHLRQGIEQDLQGLTEARARLTSEVEALERYLSSERSRLRILLDELANLVDGVHVGVPAARPDGVVWPAEVLVLDDMAKPDVTGPGAIQPAAMGSDDGQDADGQDADGQDADGRDTDDTVAGLRGAGQLGYQGPGEDGQILVVDDTGAYMAGDDRRSSAISRPSGVQ